MQGSPPTSRDIGEHFSKPSGIALMALAMLAVPFVDALAKYLSADDSPLFMGWARYAVATLVVLLDRGVSPGTGVDAGAARLRGAGRAALAGYIVFSEGPDVPTLVGGFIVAAGFVLLGER